MKIVIPKRRSNKEIGKKAHELFEKVWYDRHMNCKKKYKKDKTPKSIIKRANKAEQRIIEIYGLENLGPYTDFEWGMLCGEYAALNWILDSELEWEGPGTLDT